MNTKKVFNFFKIENFRSEFCWWSVLRDLDKNIHTSKSEESVKSWVSQIANRTIIDYYRSSGREVNIDLETLRFEDQISTAKESLSKCILPFIDALSEKSTRLLKAIDIEGESQKEYDERVEIKYWTLKSQVKKRRSELRNAFYKGCNLTLYSSIVSVKCLFKSYTCMVFYSSFIFLNCYRLTYRRNNL